MNAVNNRTFILLILVVAGTLVAQFPQFEEHFLIPATAAHPHLVTLAEGIIGVIALWIAGRRGSDEVASRFTPAK